jgi:MtN3 and saliva related transmembrane protein
MEYWVSALAAILTTGAFLPQALHIIRHRETKAISLVMYVAFASGVALWLVFGVLIGNWAIIVSNAITFALTSTIVALKLRYG